MYRLFMARGTRAAAGAVQRREMPRRSARTKAAAAQETPTKVKKEEETNSETDDDNGSVAKSATGKKRAAAKPERTTTPKKKVKREEEDSDKKTTTTPSPKKEKKQNQKQEKASPRKRDNSSSSNNNNKADDLQSKKLKAYAQYANKSPFPDFGHPTPAECKLAHRILASLHGARNRPETVVAPTARAGCGDSPSVLDALVRTILSQNTSDTNSTRAKQSMDKAYGRSDKWEAIVEGGRPKLQEAIKCGGLSVVKSKVIISILEQVQERYGTYSLDHLHEASSEEAMREMLSFQGVGPKTASCVLLFCLRRESFAVDTHVHRITGLLGWRPAKASRDETHQHLDVMIPDEDKYGLHILLVSHGKKCDECRAGGKSLGKCELRKAFRKGKLKGEAGEEVKEEEEEQEDVKIKDEDEDEEDVD